ncbi:MAG: hypothetical protein PVI79_01500 [Gammaproteobacteria bacterium]|jgi:hypothetical protein
MRTGIFIVLLGFGLFLQPASAGDNLTIPGHIPTSQTQSMPKRGISMEDVLEQFGEPRERHGPVGEPPITEWIYNSFAVYFEGNIVLHSIDLDTLIMPK